MPDNPNIDLKGRINFDDTIDENSGTGFANDVTSRFSAVRDGVNVAIQNREIYSSTALYDVNDMVVWTDGLDYRALSAPPMGTPPSNATYWKSTGAAPVAAQNQILFFVTTDASLPLRATATQNTTGTPQTPLNGDSSAARKTKLAAILGVPESDINPTPPVTRYIVAGLSGSAGNYDLSTGASGMPSYAAASLTRALPFDGVHWNITNSSTGAVLATSATSDILGAWNNGVTVTASSFAFGGVANFVEIIVNRAGQNFPEFYPSGTTPTNWYSAAGQQGVIAGPVASRRNASADRGFVYWLYRRVETLAASAVAAITSLKDGNGASTGSATSVTFPNMVKDSGSATLRNVLYVTVSDVTDSAGCATALAAALPGGVPDGLTVIFTDTNPTAPPLKQVTRSANYTMDGTEDRVDVDTTGGTRTITLPLNFATFYPGQSRRTITNIGSGSNNATVQCNTGISFPGGGTSKVLGVGDTLEVYVSKRADNTYIWATI